MKTLIRGLCLQKSYGALVAARRARVRHGQAAVNRRSPVRGVYFVAVRESSRTVEADTVVMSTGYRANDSLFRALKGQVKELYAIGDCNAPRRALDAIHEGFKTAFNV